MNETDVHQSHVDVVGDCRLPFPHSIGETPQVGNTFGTCSGIVENDCLELILGEKVKEGCLVRDVSIGKGFGHGDTDQQWN